MNEEKIKRKKEGKKYNREEKTEKRKIKNRKKEKI